jgi:hypothetical protein
MPLWKNLAGQKVAVYAYDPTTAPGSDPSKTGDQANITAEISKDGGVSAATNDVNPTQLDATDHPGVYLFDLTKDESNANLIVISPVSSTENVLLEVQFIYTVPGGLYQSATTIRTGTVEDATTTPTTTNFSAADITEATADHFIGRVIIFTSGALFRQATEITDYSLVSGEGNFTVAALTEAPADGDTFVIV